MAMVGALGLESKLSNARGAYLALGTPFSFTSSFLSPTKAAKEFDGKNAEAAEAGPTMTRTESS